MGIRVFARHCLESGLGIGGHDVQYLTEGSTEVFLHNHNAYKVVSPSKANGVDAYSAVVSQDTRHREADFLALVLADAVTFTISVVPATQYIPNVGEDKLAEAVPRMGNLGASLVWYPFPAFGNLPVFPDGSRGGPCVGRASVAETSAGPAFADATPSAAGEGAWAVVPGVVDDDANDAPAFVDGPPPAASGSMYPWSWKAVRRYSIAW